MKEEIIEWLQGPRIIQEGAALYDKYGYNKRLKEIFNRRSDESTMEILVYELGKLSGLSEDEVKNLKRYAKKEIKFTPKKEVKKNFIDDLLLELAGALKVSVDDMFLPGTLTSATNAQVELIAKLAPAYEQIPETVKKTIRFREKYPFLKSPDCPQELKILVHDMFSAYDAYREAHAKLDTANTQDENLLNAATVVENYLENRAIWAELDHYKETGEVLGKHEMFDLLKMRAEIAAMTDIALVNKIKNVKPNITKAKNALEKATDDKRPECIARLDKWETYTRELEAELDRRKK